MVQHTKLSKVHVKAASAHNKSRRRYTEKLAINFIPYLKRLNRTMNPDLNLTKATANILNQLINDICDRLLTEVRILRNRGVRKTLDVRDIECALKLLLPPDLQQCALLEAKKSILVFSSFGHAYTEPMTEEYA